MKKIFLSFVAILFYSCPSLEEDNYTKCDESHSYPYWTDWTDGNLISIIDDSLAAVSTLKYKKECLGYNREDIVSFRTGLFLVNYRTRQKPLRGDTLELEYKVLNSYYMYLALKILNGYLFRDTSALVLDVKNSKFGFWKIGEKSIKFKDHNKVSSDYSTFAGFAQNAGYWENGSIIFPDVYDMNILDTEKGQIEQFKYSVQYDWMPRHEWMQKYLCNSLFLSYIGDKAVCVNSIYAGRDSTIENRYTLLLVDGIPVDTIKFSGNVSGKMFGNYFSAQGRIFKIDTLNLKFDKDFSLWIDEKPLTFCKNGDKNPDDCVSYSGQDLINFKGDKP